MRLLLHLLCLSPILFNSQIVLAQGNDQPELKIAFSRSMMLGKGVKPITQRFCSGVATSVGGIKITCVYPNEDFTALGKKLSVGSDFQLAAIWGIEYGWLKQRHSGLEILVVTKGKFAGDVGASSKLLVRKELMDGKKPQDLLKSFSPQRPFRLARHKWESLVTNLHLLDLHRKYGKDRFKDPAKPLENGQHALTEIRRDHYDGMLIDEYRFMAMNRRFALQQNFQLVGDWGVREKPLEVPLVAVVGVRQKVTSVTGKEWNDFQERIIRYGNSEDPDAKEFRRVWQSSGLDIPTEEFGNLSIEIARQYAESDLAGLSN